MGLTVVVRVCGGLPGLVRCIATVVVEVAGPGRAAAVPGYLWRAAAVAVASHTATATHRHPLILVTVPPPETCHMW